jgi:hypothetical protein
MTVDALVADLGFEEDEEFDEDDFEDEDDE